MPTVKISEAEARRRHAAIWKAWEEMPEGGRTKTRVCAVAGLQHNVTPTITRYGLELPKFDITRRVYKVEGGTPGDLSHINELMAQVEHYRAKYEAMKMQCADLGQQLYEVLVNNGNGDDDDI